ncbi:VENN motif pre-toxin domain-containing protein [Citrobacter farmeri]|uniref:VENN motif-containing domain-containing protein n=1 Tax=Citrobacter amalonaticus Y19 TaxID=1261127 RepID=A0A0F6RG77_CITAM|nr:VENN motif pre-toxin domain-containing protein [Citrobacter amalonaticus]AKE60060.1 hypothetical protein F384_16600 [Citrobacter amalonaticus Y19]
MKAGAIGAISASAMTDHLVSALYGKDVSQLTADEKRLVSSLVTIAGGLQRRWKLRIIPYVTSSIRR